MKVHNNYLLTIAFGIGASVYIFSILNVPTQTGGESLSPLEPFFNTTQAYILPVSDPSNFPIAYSDAGKPVISAKAALVYDLNSDRILFSRNPRTKLPVASLTKLVTALVVREYTDLREEVIVPKEAVRVDKEKQDLFANETLTTEQLLTVMLVGSSNDAAYALSSHVASKGINFVEAMNRKAMEIGMTESQFIDPAGLDDKGYSTAQDIAKLLKRALRDNVIQEILITPAVSLGDRQFKNTNQLLDSINNIQGGKTGNTETALGCMVLSVDIGNRRDTIITVVLGSRGRFEETQILVNWALTSHRWE